MTRTRGGVTFFPCVQRGNSEERLMGTITEREAGQVQAANASGKTPAVFIHGLWLLPSSWDGWAGAFEAAGYAPLAPGWPDGPETAEEARRAPEGSAAGGVAQLADRRGKVIGALERKPVIVGHSFGGLLAQILAGRGLSAGKVAVDQAPFRGVVALPVA